MNDFKVKKKADTEMVLLQKQLREIYISNRPEYEKHMPNLISEYTFKHQQPISVL